MSQRADITTPRSLSALMRRCKGRYLIAYDGRWHLSAISFVKQCGTGEVAYDTVPISSFDRYDQISTTLFKMMGLAERYLVPPPDAPPRRPKKE